MGHGRSHLRERSRRRLALVLILVAAYMVAEVIGGLLSGSLALLADAGHMLADAGALGLALFAAWIAERPASSRRTFGFYRAEILAALINGGLLVTAAVLICLEAWGRLWEPVDVRSGPMIAVAAGGLFVNLAGMWILRSSRNESLNLRGAWLHLLSDLFGSVGAVAAGLAIWRLGWLWADPAASLVISALILISAWNLLKESVAVLMEGAPGHVDVDGVRDALMQMDGVVQVHDLHVWTITTGLESLSAHVVVRESAHSGELLQKIRVAMRERFGIDHITIQIEPEDFEEEGLHS